MKIEAIATTIVAGKFTFKAHICAHCTAIEARLGYIDPTVTRPISIGPTAFEIGVITAGTSTASRCATIVIQVGITAAGSTRRHWVLLQWVPLSTIGFTIDTTAIFAMNSMDTGTTAAATP